MEEEKPRVVKLKIGDYEIEGTTEDIKELMESVEALKSMMEKISEAQKTEKLSRSGRSSIKDVIFDLVEEGFFNEPKSLSEIRKELISRGKNEESSSISPILKRDFIDKRILRREGERRSFRYVLWTKREVNPISISVLK